MIEANSSRMSQAAMTTPTSRAMRWPRVARSRGASCVGVEPAGNGLDRRLAGFGRHRASAPFHM